MCIISLIFLFFLNDNPFKYLTETMYPFAQALGGGLWIRKHILLIAEMVSVWKLKTFFFS